MRPWGVRTSRPATPDPGPVVVAFLGVLAALLVAASVLLPYVAHLARPQLPVVVGGLTILVCGLVLLRERSVGPVGWLVYAAGISYFLPALAVSGAPDIDRAIRCTALLHIALLTHGALVVGSPRLRGRAELIAVVCGYAVALTAVVGGYRVALPALGVVVVTAVLLSGQRLPAPVRSWRRAAGLVLGVGLVVDAVLRLGTGLAAESWVTVAHPVEIAVTALFVAVAGTRPSTWQSIEVRLDGTDSLTDVVADQLGATDLTLALDDGVGGWLLPTGEPRAMPEAPAWTVTAGDATAGAATAVAVIDGDVVTPVPPSVDHVLRLAAANARLRRSLVRHVEELEESRRRLLSAADGERAALGSQLRARAIASVASVERELRRHPGLGSVHARATDTRRQLELIARGIDPVATAGSLCQALDELAAAAVCAVVVTDCVEPTAPDVARALWFCCAEAAANTAKHAPSSTLLISVARTDGRVVARLSDDGPGGATLLGSGLRGLVDRVETLDGSLRLQSPADCGTTITIELPDPSEDCGQPQSSLRGDADPLRADPTYVRGNRHLGGTS